MFNVHIKSLKIFGFHGAYKAERINGQEFIIDASIQYEIKKIEDDVASVLDYVELIEIISERFNKKKYKVLEKLSLDIAIFLSDRYSQIQSTTIKIKKVNPPIKFDIDFIEVKHTYKI